MECAGGLFEALGCSCDECERGENGPPRHTIILDDSVPWSELAQTLRELREQQRLLGLSHHLVRKLQKLIDRL